jgi:DNA-binding transcriptional MerR regulator
LFKQRRRYTLKADPDRSFQPQDANGELIDIVRFLIRAGLPLDKLRQELRAHPTANRGAKPYVLKDSIAIALYEWLEQQASIKLTGKVLELIRRNNPQLASSSGKKKELADRFIWHDGDIEFDDEKSK